ncbi:MAG: nucleotidyltransferase family protein [Planctomycetota bacterium]|jgi:ppGpp synthetase/RelA/SpoT-type nucleotidyltranferase
MGKKKEKCEKQRKLTKEENEIIEKLNISKEDYLKSRVKIQEIREILQDYEGDKDLLKANATSVLEMLRNLQAVHSLRMRIKESNSLIRKIIRKQIEQHKLSITKVNYRKHITDTIGIRVLHLHKTDWYSIHDFIMGKWDLSEKPFAYIRKGDDEEFYQEKQCAVRVHNAGYRSVHYLLKTKPCKEEYLVEIQVRTLFEEGWSEIDHNIRYPHDMNNDILNKYLSLFNRLAGSADEMGTFILLLKAYLNKQDETRKGIQKELQDKNKEISDMIKRLKITSTEKRNLEKKIANLSKSKMEYDDSSLAISSEFRPAGGINWLQQPASYAAHGIETTKCKRCGKEMVSYSSIYADGLCDSCRLLQSMDISQPSIHF